MMAILNEDCMHHINAYLKPHDWIHVSAVCQLWNSVTKSNWKTITEINFMGNRIKCDAAILISLKDAKKIVRQAAPFVKVLIASSRGRFIKIGHHCYKVYNSSSFYGILNLLAYKATEITDVYFKCVRRTKLVKTFFKKNKIKKLKIDRFYDWYFDVPFHGIEDLDLKIPNRCASKLVGFLEGRFPNLKNLTLEINTDLIINGADVLSTIWSHVRGIKSLNLMVHAIFITENTYTLLLDVTQLSQLEELSVKVCDLMPFAYPELFLNQLPKYCPKLRVLKIMGCIHVNDESLRLLLSLPQLESFEFGRKSSFPLIELPKMEHLSELRVKLILAKPPFTGFFRAVEKMHQLKALTIDFFNDVHEQELLHLVCGVAAAAVFLGKDVLVTRLYCDQTFKKLRISKTNNYKAAEIFHDEDIQWLKLSFQYNDEKTLFKGVKEFVRNNLHYYHTFILEN